MFEEWISKQKTQKTFPLEKSLDEMSWQKLVEQIAVCGEKEKKEWVEIVLLRWSVPKKFF